MNKQFFNKIPLPIKLILIGLIPTAFLLYLTIEIQKEKSQNIETLDSFMNQLNQTTIVLNVVDNLQQERRLTFGSSFNEKVKSTMFIQRNKTDDAIGTLDQFNEKNLTDYKSFTLINQLKSFRSKIDADSIPTDEIIEVYSNMISRMDNLSVISARNTSLSSLSNEIDGQTILSQMISSLGSLRVYYYAINQSAEINPTLMLRIQNNYNLFKAIEQEFLVKADKNSITEYSKIKASTDYKVSLEKIESILKNKKIDANYNAEEWWNISANAVDQLKVFQRNISQKVLAKANDIYENEKSARIRSLLFLVFIIVIVLLVVAYTIKNITNSLTEVKEVATKISQGITEHELPQGADDAIGSLINSILLIDNSNIELSKAAHEIGQGNFDININSRSDEDVLGNAIIKMKNDLSQFNQENADKMWLQEGINSINESVMGEKNLKELCNISLRTLLVYLDAQLGTFYITNDKFYEYISGYAVDEKLIKKQNFIEGQTQIGEAVRTKKIIVLNNLPAEYIKISSSLGDIAPSHILIIPLQFNESVEGVIEIASVEPFTKLDFELINQASSIIGIALQASKSKQKLQELLEETQAQSEELQTQHNELENMNAELEAQAQKLQASEEELKVQQEELLETNTELEERSVQLQQRNSEVEQKAKELAITTKYKSEFLANMSHELRTPLNSILLLSRLLLDNNNKHLNDEELEYAKVIQNSGTGLLELINEILDLSKIETGNMDLEVSRINVNDLMTSVGSLFVQIAKEKNIDFKININTDIPETIETDRMRLEQILKNLVSNAIKFTSQGSVTMSIALCPDRKDFICFSVKDTGIGIPKEKHGLIFEAFQQADGSTKRKYGGTGLGLSISRELVKLLQGDIHLNSEINKGSEFIVHIPIKISEVVILDLENKIETPEILNEKTEESDKFLSAEIPNNVADDKSDFQKNDKCILIVEDDVNFSKSLVEYTRKKGYKAITCVRGDKALELAKKYKPQGILLDIQLPIKSGWQVMDELKNEPETRHIPVHIMSSHSMKKESLLKGAVNFIDKPVAFEQLKAVFEKIEYVLTKNPKKVLIVEDNSKHAQALAYFLGTFDIKSEIKSNITEGAKALKTKDAECVILDMGIPSNQSYEALEELKKDPDFENLPIIIFTGKSLSVGEEMKIKKYADSIVVKTAHSYQRMLDEVSIFLHVVEDNKKLPTHVLRKDLGTLNDVLKDKKVLIVDDDIRNIFSLTKSLEALKLEVYTAVNGKEALNQLNENPKIDIVLLDMMMPELDGYDTAKRIRQEKKWKELPVIAVTAKAMSGDREKCLNAGASDYISKPIDIDQLLSLMRVWLYK